MVQLNKAPGPLANVVAFGVVAVAPLGRSCGPGGVEVEMAEGREFTSKDTVCFKYKKHNNMPISTRILETFQRLETSMP